jgi:hypothetical protein
VRAVDYGPLVLQVAVTAFVSVRRGGGVHRRWRARATKVTDAIGRFDDESR